MIPSFFLPWHTWLESRPEFIDGEQGCEMIATKVAQLADAHFQTICEEPLVADSALRFAAALRVWAALAFHWRQQACSLDEQVRKLAAKIGSTGHLGSDPLQDTVLCEAVLHGHPKAIEFFGRAYRETILSQTRVQPLLQGQRPLIGREFHSADDCVTSFMIYVSGYSNAAGEGFPDVDEEMEVREPSADEGPLPPSSPSLADWTSFMTETILDICPSQRDSTRQAITDWMQQELGRRDPQDLKEWWTCSGVPRNALQRRGVPLAKYRGDSGLAAGFIARCAEYFVKGVLRQRRFAGDVIDDLQAPPEQTAPSPLSPACLEQIRRWLAAALEAWSVFGTRDQDEAMAFIRENFDDLPYRSFQFTSDRRAQASDKRWEQFQRRSQRMHLAFLLEVEQDWSNLEISSQLGKAPGEVSRLLGAAHNLLHEVLQSLKMTRRIELRACVDASDLDALKSALLAEWRNVTPENDQP